MNTDGMTDEQRLAAYRAFAPHDPDGPIGFLVRRIEELEKIVGLMEEDLVTAREW